MKTVSPAKPKLEPEMGSSALQAETDSKPNQKYDVNSSSPAPVLSTKKQKQKLKVCLERLPVALYSPLPP